MALSAADQAVRDRFASLNLPQAYWDLVPLYDAKEGDPAGDWYDYWVPMVHKQYLLDQIQTTLGAAQTALEGENATLSAEFALHTGLPPSGNPNGVDTHFAVNAGGSANAFTITRAPVQTDPLVAGQTFLVTWPEANTGAATLQIDGLAAVAIEINGAALVGYELDANLITWVLFNGTVFELLLEQKTHIDYYAIKGPQLDSIGFSDYPDKSYFEDDLTVGIWYVNKLIKGVIQSETLPAGNTPLYTSAVPGFPAGSKFFKAPYTGDFEFSYLINPNQPISTGATATASMAVRFRRINAATGDNIVHPNGSTYIMYELETSLWFQGDNYGSTNSAASHSFTAKLVKDELVSFHCATSVGDTFDISNGSLDGYITIKHL